MVNVTSLDDLTAENVLDPKYWKEKIKTDEDYKGSCGGFCLYYFGILNQLVPELNPRIMECGNHYYLETDTRDQSDRFIIDPEIIFNDNRFFYVGTFKDCQHGKGQDYYRGAKRSTDIEKMWQDLKDLRILKYFP